MKTLESIFHAGILETYSTMQLQACYTIFVCLTAMCHAACLKIFEIFCYQQQVMPPENMSEVEVFQNGQTIGWFQ